MNKFTIEINQKGVWWEAYCKELNISAIADERLKTLNMLMSMIDVNLLIK